MMLRSVINFLHLLEVIKIKVSWQKYQLCSYFVPYKFALLLPQICWTMVVIDTLFFNAFDCRILSIHNVPYRGFYCQLVVDDCWLRSHSMFGHCDAVMIDWLSTWLMKPFTQNSSNSWLVFCFNFTRSFTFLFFLPIVDDYMTA